jgi:hypothetical protein
VPRFADACFLWDLKGVEVAQKGVNRSGRIALQLSFTSGRFRSAIRKPLEYCDGATVATHTEKDSTEDPPEVLRPGTQNSAMTMPGSALAPDYHIAVFWIIQ